MRLLACSKDAIDFKAELAATENKYEAEQITAASWEASAEGGTWIHRTLTTAKWIAIGAGVSHAAGSVARVDVLSGVAAAAGIVPEA